MMMMINITIGVYLDPGIHLSKPSKIKITTTKCGSAIQGLNEICLIVLSSHPEKCMGR
jgi:hypothetical protein